MGRQGDILVVNVVERPAINKLTVTGNQDIKSEELLKGLSDIDLSEGETFNRPSLDSVTQELTRQYNNRGQSNVELSPSLSNPDRHRVEMTLTIKDGKPAKTDHTHLIDTERQEKR